MSKQTINIGASPNDGTGTPLRTSFDYTNQNFTELYTAVGPSGNNIVVPGTATITGDLTAARLIVTGGTIPANGLWLATTNTLEFAANSLAQYRIAPLGVFSWYDGAGGTRMTLNSTGLGVGDAPATSTRLTVVAASRLADTTGQAYIRSTDAQAQDIGAQFTLGGLFNASSHYPFGGIAGRKENSTSGNVAGYLDFLTTTSGGSLTSRMRIDSTGNLGIGVTPSAIANVIRLEIGGALSTNLTLRSSSTNTSARNWMVAANAITFGDFVIRQGNSQGAEPNSGTDRLVIDLSGNLLVGKAVSSFSTVGVEASQIGFLSLTNSASTNAATNLSLYSTGAAAFRFYVGLAGTVFATNTVISAISDARLKENVQDIDVGLNAILSLKPRKFDWKAGKGKDIKGDRGFIAQEFETVFPNLVDEWKDPAPEGEAPYKSVRQDLIPVLVKALQELTARVQTLEAR